MGKITKIPTLNMSREDWLKERRHSIGGSDAAAVMGLSKWATPYTVYLDKLGVLEAKEETEAMRQGRDLEAYVAKRFEEATGKRVRRENAILRNDDYPFAHADVDRLVVGERAGLECKTTSTLDVRKFRDVEFPEQYYAQCVHYLAVTGLDRWYLAVLVLGREFHVYTLERDEDEIKALMDTERDFWKHVESETPPPVDGFEPTTEALKTVYADDNGEEIDFFDQYTDLLDEREVLLAQQKEIGERIAEVENQIKLEMGETAKAVCGPYRITWKAQTRSTFQYKDLAKDHPEIDLTRYFKESSSRPFKITKQKPKKEDA